MNILEKMIQEAKAEAAAQWEATRKNQGAMLPRTEWASQAEAEKANPGFSFTCFWKNARGNWQCA